MLYLYVTTWTIQRTKSHIKMPHNSYDSPVLCELHICMYNCIYGTYIYVLYTYKIKYIYVHLPSTGNNMVIKMKFRENKNSKTNIKSTKQPAVIWLLLEHCCVDNTHINFIVLSNYSRCSRLFIIPRSLDP